MARPDDDETHDHEERYSDLIEDATLDFEDEGEHSASAHSESVFIVDDEEAGRESFARGSSATLDLVIEQAEFAEDVGVDADPNAKDEELGSLGTSDIARRHLRGLLEALLFVTDRPLKAADLADVARADTKEVRTILEELSEQYRADGRGYQLDELAGGWQMRTSAAFAPFVREMTNAKPVRLSRAQVETLAIVAYRQPITRPEIEDIRGVDAGAVLKLLLERDMVRVLGKKDEPGRPLLYGTTTHFLTFFGLKTLKDLPTLREFTELSDESRDVVERELGDVLPEGAPSGAEGSRVANEPPPNVVGDASVAAADVMPEGEPSEHRAPAEVLTSEEAELAKEREAANDVEETAETEEQDKPGGAGYDPSDEELYPDDDDEDDEDDEDDDDDGEDDDDDGEEETE